MPQTPTPSRLCRRWVHSHEEDSGGAQVYRPDDHAFAPSRGRRCLELRRDGSLLETRAGADDRPHATHGRWELAGRTLRLVSDEPTRSPERELEIVSLESDRLVLR